MRCECHSDFLTGLPLRGVGPQLKITRSTSQHSFPSTKNSISQKEFRMNSSISHKRSGCDRYYCSLAVAQFNSKH